MRRRRRERRGAIAVLACIMMVVLIGFFALAVDVGNICLHKGEAQNAADAGALAGAGTLFTNPEALETEVYSYPYVENARYYATEFTRDNKVAQYGPPNKRHPLREKMDPSNVSVTIGQWDGEVVTPDEWSPNAVQVTTTVPDAVLLFGFLKKVVPTQATAVARVHYPHLLPFTIYAGAWDAGEREVFPGPWNGTDLPPGNFGTLHIGHSGGGASELRDQIADGLDADDLSPWAGSIEPGTEIYGDTGMSVGMEVAFNGGTADGQNYPGIIGEPRFIALYDYVEGNGSNALFRIVRFVAVRVVECDLKGGDKHITLAPVTDMSKLVGLRLVK